MSKLHVVEHTPSEVEHDRSYLFHFCLSTWETPRIIAHVRDGPRSAWYLWPVVYIPQ